jgi:hypothetical protein
MQCMYEDCCSMLRSFACIILLCIPIELMVKFPPWSKRNYNNTSTYITVFGLPLVEQDSDGESDNTVHSDDDLQDAQSTHLTTSRSHHSASTPNSNRSRSQTADPTSPAEASTRTPEFQEKSPTFTKISNHTPSSKYPSYPL